MTGTRHAAITMRVHGLSRSEAERFAFEAVLIDWLNATHPDKPSDRCAHCGRCAIISPRILKRRGTRPSGPSARRTRREPL